jgi:hypothetical protein
MPELLDDATEETAPSGVAVTGPERQGFRPEHSTSPPQAVSALRLELTR